MTTDSMEALKAFLEGEKAMRAGSLDLRKAYGAFQRAVQLDPTFSLAWYRLAYATGFDWETDPTFEYLEEALSQADRLSERDRLRVHALYHFFRARPEEAERVLKEIIDKYPDDAEAWVLLGQVYAYFNWRRGRSYREMQKLVRDCAERAQRLDPTNFDAAFGLLLTALEEEEYEEAERQLRIVFGETGPFPVFYRAELALRRGDQPSWEQVLLDLENLRIGRRAQGKHMWWFSFVFDVPDHPDRVREYIHALLLSDSRSAGQKVGGHITLATYAAARGRWSEAKNEVEAAERLYPAAAVEHAALLSLAPFLKVPREDLIAMRDKLTQWNPKTARPRADFPYPPGLRPALRPYLLGLLHARLGDEATALGHADELEQIPSPEHMPSMPQDLALSVRAHVAVNDRRFEDALALLEQLRMDVHPSRCNNYAPYIFTMLTLERFLRAELLHQLGRGEESLGWYEDIHPTPSYAFAHFRVGEIRERLGDKKEAIKHYDLFTRFWSDCDPQLRPVLEEAKRRLERLRRADGG